MIKRAVYAGTFDPVTFGHLDIIQRAAKLVGELVVAVATNVDKTPLFSVDERLQLLKKSAGRIRNVRIDAFAGMAVDYVQQIEASALVRGVRTVADFENEFAMALTNRVLAPDVETFFVMASQECSFISSRLTKEIASLGGDVVPFVPPGVARALMRKYKRSAP